MICYRWNYRISIPGTLFLLLCCLPWFVAAAPTPESTKKVSNGGVGLQVVPIVTGEIVVIAVLPDSPASKAKLAPGDLIIAVDGNSLRGSNFADLTKTRLWGAAGSKVKLTWLRPGVAGKNSAQLVRTLLTEDPAKDLEVKMLVPAMSLPREDVKP